MPVSTHSRNCIKKNTLERIKDTEYRSQKVGKAFGVFLSYFGFLCIQQILIWAYEKTDTVGRQVTKMKKINP